MENRLTECADNPTLIDEKLPRARQNTETTACYDTVVHVRVLHGGCSRSVAVSVLPPPAGALDDQNTAVIPAFTSQSTTGGKWRGGAPSRRRGYPGGLTHAVPTVLTVPAGYIVLRLSAINDAGQVVRRLKRGPTPLQIPRA